MLYQECMLKFIFEVMMSILDVFTPLDNGDITLANGKHCIDIELRHRYFVPYKKVYLSVTEPDNAVQCCTGDKNMACGTVKKDTLTIIADIKTDVATISWQVW
jgi:hypothetical protein